MRVFKSKHFGSLSANAISAAATIKLTDPSVSVSNITSLIPSVAAKLSSGYNLAVTYGNLLSASSAVSSAAAKVTVSVGAVTASRSPLAYPRSVRGSA